MTLKQKAVNSYRAVLKATHQTFKGDVKNISGLRYKAREIYNERKNEQNETEIEKVRKKRRFKKYIQEAHEAARFIKRNILQTEYDESKSRYSKTLMYFVI
jgi:cytolysin (calcineurin-like family phosphatase)